MTVGGHHHSTRPGVSFLAHDLVTYTSAGAVEIYPHAAGKLFNLAVFGQVGLTGILNVVIQRKHRLAGVGNFLGADGVEFGYYSTGIIVRHHVRRAD